MFGPLRENRTYRRLFLAQVTALGGTGLSTVALALLAYDLAGPNAGAVLGTALALKMIAYVFIAPVTGGIVHRLPRRAVLIGLDIARAGLVLCLVLVDQIWQIYALIFLINACSAGFTPTFQATIPDILPDERDYTRALSLSRLAYDLENLLSPTVAALALMVVGFDVLFAANGFAFLVSAALVMSVRLPASAPTSRAGGAWSTLTFGIRAYLATPRLRGLLCLSLAVAASGAMVIVNTVVYVQGTLGGSATETALAFAAAGGGSMAVALALPRLLERKEDRPVMLMGGFLLAVGLGLGLARPDLFGLLAIWVLLGAGSSLIQTPAGRLLRRSSRDEDRPAFYSAQFALSHACWLICYPLAGWLGATHGLAASFAAMAGLVIVGAAGAWCLWPAGEHRELDHQHHAMDHEHLHTHDDLHHQHDHEGWEGPEPHRHPHRHAVHRHRHPFLIDDHHPSWPVAGRN